MMEPTAVETVTHLFSWICGQERSFIVDGAPLPVDQRCLGLYAGATLTAVWLIASGIWRRGMPGGSVLVGNVAVLLTAMLGGLHVIDPGPLWRLLFGLWTGHVVVLWLVGAASHLRTLPQSDTQSPPAWRLSDKAQGLVFPAALAGLAALFPVLSHLGWNFWATTAASGVAVILIAALLSFWSVACFVARMGPDHT